MSNLIGHRSLSEAMAQITRLPLPLCRTLVRRGVAPADVPALAAAGYRAIICNRPDGEAPDQPPFAVIAEAAQRAGLPVRYLPVAQTVCLFHDGEVWQAPSARAQIEVHDAAGRVVRGAEVPVLVTRADAAPLPEVFARVVLVAEGTADTIATSRGHRTRVRVAVAPAAATAAITIAALAAAVTASTSVPKPASLKVTATSTTVPTAGTRTSPSRPWSRRSS